MSHQNKTEKKYKYGNKLKSEQELPNISIVIPVHNNQRTIGRCIESVQNQHYPKHKLEIIVVDDGSSDESAATAKRLGAKVQCQMHSGRGHARNRGVDEARFEIVGFLDADDVADKSWLMESASRLNDPRVDGIGCTHRLLNNNSDFVKIAWLDRYYRFTLSVEKTSHLGTSGSLFKKNVFNKVHGFDPSLVSAEDMDLCSKIIGQGHELRMVKKPLIKVEYPENLFEYIKKQAQKVAYMVVCFFKPRTTRRVGGSYVHIVDYAQGVLPIALALSCFFFTPLQILAGFGVMVILLMALSTPFCRFVFNLRKKHGLSRLWPVTILFYVLLRASSWSIGLVYGVYITARFLVVGFFTNRGTVDESIHT